MAGASGDSSKYILVVDIGTTTIRAYIYNERAQIVGSSLQKVMLMQPHVGWVEMDPEQLWTQIHRVMSMAMLDAGLTAADITCMGITAQRGSFINWNRNTGEYYHNFITWQDRRAADLVATWNRSWRLFFFNWGSWILYKLTGIKRFLAGSVYCFRLQHATLRVKWMYLNNKELWEDAKRGDVCFGNLNTWMLWKLTGGKQFATDYSFASSTGLYDPFQMEWSGLLSLLVNYPTSVLPPIYDTCFNYGETDAELFGASIPIVAMMADQQSSVFGQCCFNQGDMKCTLGTGGFMQVNTGSKPHQSIAGLYPLIGWKIGDELVYIVEGMVADLGRCMDWLKDIGFVSDVTELNDVASSLQDTGGLYCVPGFSGLQKTSAYDTTPPIDDDFACASMMGLTLDTRTEHMTKAVLDGVVYRLLALYRGFVEELPHISNTTSLRIDGGVSGCEYVLQNLSNLTERTLDLPHNTEMTSLGVAFVAGLYTGIWADRSVIQRLRTTRKQYTPQALNHDHQTQYNKWMCAVKRSKAWYTTREFQEIPNSRIR